MPNEDFATHLEAQGLEGNEGSMVFMISPISQTCIHHLLTIGLASSTRKLHEITKAEVVKYMRQDLRESSKSNRRESVAERLPPLGRVSGNIKAKMHYTTFLSAVVLKHEVDLVGWPVKVMRDPSVLSRDQVKEIHARLTSNPPQLYFVKLTETQLAARRKLMKKNGEEGYVPTMKAPPARAPGPQKDKDEDDDGWEDIPETASGAPNHGKGKSGRSSGTGEDSASDSGLDSASDSGSGSGSDGESDSSNESDKSSSSDESDAEEVPSGKGKGKATGRVKPQPKKSTATSGSDEEDNAAIASPPPVIAQKAKSKARQAKEMPRPASKSARKDTSVPNTGSATPGKSTSPLPPSAPSHGRPVRSPTPFPSPVNNATPESSDLQAGSPPSHAFSPAASAPVSTGLPKSQPRRALPKTCQTATNGERASARTTTDAPASTQSPALARSSPEASSSSALKDTKSRKRKAAVIDLGYVDKKFILPPGSKRKKIEPKKA